MTWDVWSVILSWIGAIIAAIASHRAWASAKEANKIQGELLEIEKARRHDEEKLTQLARLDIVARPFTSEYGLSVRSLGPGTASSVTVLLDGEPYDINGNGRDMPKGDIMRVTDVPKNWSATKSIERFSVRWVNPNGESEEAAFVIE